MAQPILTIGFPVFRDFDGLYFSAGDIPLSHPEVADAVEIVVVDNDPESQAGKDTKKWVENQLAGCVRARYVAAPGPGGPALAKQRCVDEAAGKYVLVMDSHVRIARGGLRRLLDFYQDNPETSNLYSGPMFYDSDAARAGRGDDLGGFATHMEEVWRGENLGIWATDRRGASLDAEPFEVPAMGCGLFTCRKATFVGFNEHFRGFGGEECYIHHKTRQAGNRCLCLPFLRWVHRFARPNGVPYPLRLWDKVRNYVIGHQELGLDLAPIFDHFVAVRQHTFTDVELASPNLYASLVQSGRVSEADWERLNNDATFSEACRNAQSNPTSVAQHSFVTHGRMTEKEWEYLVADPIGHIDPPQDSGCGSCGKENRTLEQLFEDAAKTPSPLNEHAAKLRELASQCDTVVDLGHQSYVSTVALLAGQPQKLISYDSRHDSAWDRLQDKRGKTAFQFGQADITAIDIPECDLLFEDSIHTAEHVFNVLTKHAPNVRRWIAIHDTAVFGEIGEDKGPGILPALRGFMRDHPEWSVIYHTQANYGLTVLGKLPGDKPKLPSLPRMAWNYAKALAHHAANGGKMADQTTIDSRMDICVGCEQRTTEDRIGVIFNRCSVCGCYLDEGPSQREGKVLWAESFCPLSKWGPFE